MDLWRRVDLLVRSWLQTESAAASSDAWEELEAFLRDGDLPHPGPAESGKPSDSLPQEVRQALADLDLAPGASPGEIRDAYRQQLLQYHPDRHAGRPESQATAEEVTRRLTLAYRTLSDYYGS